VNMLNNNIASLVVAATLASSLFGMAWVGIGSHYTLAQGATAGATASMAKGSQSEDNPEFYVPAETALKAGETVTWKNDDTAIHTATSGKDATPDGKFDTSLVSPGQSSEPIAMPNEPGEYPYFCTLHPWMVGTINVA
jgi:plastocyanin